MNHHFGELGDVWKHLPLAEILRLNPPRHYWETHAGSAYYPLTPSPARLHGALRFLEHAPGEPELQECAYLGALLALPDLYPGSPMLATRALGRDASYIFCDIDPESAAGLRTASAGLDARVVEADGVSAITREVQRADVDPADVLVLIDPFEPHERWTPNSKTPIELAGWLAGAGYRLFYWYANVTGEQRGWARDEIARLAPDVELWCGDILFPASFAIPGRSGAWGCGVVLANATSAEVAVCRRLGHALERMSASDYLDGNDPARLSFQVMG
ncbi:MAG: 23S rRNA (adenine(2030)-N(6))-methyltransferase RlmJ [Chloroflexota bacterium]|nr:MAG: 23S rRNA (adenine(2030)-N(6))-methyltransferase RlmJ [Chloroflexota bacterium]